MTGEKMRVYEIAKEVGIPNKDLIAKIRALGLEVNNHMSSLDADDVARIKRSLEKEKTGGAAPTVAQKLPTGTVLRRKGPAEKAEDESAPPARTAAPTTSAPAPVIRRRVEPVVEAAQAAAPRPVVRAPVAEAPKPVEAVAKPVEVAPVAKSVETAPVAKPIEVAPKPAPLVETAPAHVAVKPVEAAKLVDVAAPPKPVDVAAPKPPVVVAAPQPLETKPSAASPATFCGNSPRKSKSSKAAKTPGNAATTELC